MCSEADYDANVSASLCLCSADLLLNTVAILAQGTSWAVAVTQAFCYRCKYFLASVVCRTYIQCIPHRGRRWVKPAGRTPRSDGGSI